MWRVTESTTLTGNWATFTSSAVSHNTLALSLQVFEQWVFILWWFKILHNVSYSSNNNISSVFLLLIFENELLGLFLLQSSLLMPILFLYFSQITRWSVASISQKRTPSCYLLSSLALAWPAVSSWAQSHWTLWVCFSHEKGRGLRQSLPLPASRDTR